MKGVKKIYYLSVYSIKKYNYEDRYYPLSTATKMEGIIQALIDGGYEVEIISASPSHKNGGKSHYEQIQEGVQLKLFSSLGRKNTIIKICDRIWMLLQIIIYFIREIKPTDSVIVYHSLLYLNVIQLLKKILGFKMILEFEEMYSDVLGRKELRKQENNLIKIADKYIFPSSTMPEVLNVKDINRYIVIHGTYKAEADRNINKDKNYIDIVYAGTLDLRKGSLEAIEAAYYLPSNYRVHILGLGTETQIKEIKERIKIVNKKNNAKVFYEGVLYGEKYIQFLQYCDIGLCTQDPAASFNETSFPSKILSYMANGLRVVSVMIPSIVDSKVSKYIYFCNNQTGKAIADCIKNIDINSEYDSRKYVDILFKQSVVELQRLIKE